MVLAIDTIGAMAILTMVVYAIVSKIMTVLRKYTDTEE